MLGEEVPHKRAEEMRLKCRELIIYCCLLTLLFCSVAVGIFFHVVIKTANEVVSRCCFAADGSKVCAARAARVFFIIQLITKLV